MGRRKVEIKKIENKCKRQITFTKRRQGLFKKVGEFSTKCDAETAVVTFSNAGNVYAYGHPSVDTVVNRYLNMDGSVSSSERLHVDDTPTDSTLDKQDVDDIHKDSSSSYNQNVDDIDDVDMESQPELEAQKKKVVVDEAVALEGGEKRLLDAPLEDLNMCELEKLKYSIEEEMKSVTSIAKKC